MTYCIQNVIDFIWKEIYYQKISIKICFDELNVPVYDLLDTKPFRYNLKGDLSKINFYL